MSLLLPPQISLILKEILSKVYCLDVQNEDSSEFLDYLSSLASLLGDEVIIDGLAIAESYGVTYHHDETINVDNNSTSNETSHNNFNKKADDVDPLALDELLDTKINDERIRLQRCFSGINVLEICVNGEKAALTEDNIEKKRNSSDDSTDLFSESAENDIDSRNFCVKEETTMISKEVIPANSSELIEIQNDFLSFYEVMLSPTLQKSCFIMPNINFCCCSRFQENVIENEKQYTCAHVVATWIAKSLGTIRNIPERSESLHLISQRFTEMVNEFH